MTHNDAQDLYDMEDRPLYSLWDSPTHPGYREGIVSLAGGRIIYQVICDEELFRIIVAACDMAAVTGDDRFIDNLLQQTVNINGTPRPAAVLLST